MTDHSEECAMNMRGPFPGPCTCRKTLPKSEILDEAYEMADFIVSGRLGSMKVDMGIMAHALVAQRAEIRTMKNALFHIRDAQCDTAECLAAHIREAAHNALEGLSSKVTDPPTCAECGRTGPDLSALPMTGKPRVICPMCIDHFAQKIKAYRYEQALKRLLEITDPKQTALVAVISEALGERS